MYTTFPPNFTQSILLNNYSHYKIEAAYKFYALGSLVAETNGSNNTHGFYDSLNFNTTNNNQTFTFSVPIDSSMIDPFMRAAAGKRSRIVITLNFLNSDNKVIDNYTLSQTYYFKRIILSAYIYNKYIEH